MISIERPRHIRGTTGFMRSRLPQLLVVCRGGAVFSQPRYKRGTARIAAGRLIPGVCPTRTRESCGSCGHSPIAGSRTQDAMARSQRRRRRVRPGLQRVCYRVGSRRQGISRRTRFTRLLPLGEPFGIGDHRPDRSRAHAHLPRHLSAAAVSLYRRTTRMTAGSGDAAVSAGQRFSAYLSHAMRGGAH